MQFLDEEYLSHTINLLRNELGDKCDTSVAYGIGIGRVASVLSARCKPETPHDDDEFISYVKQALGSEHDDDDG